jgi:uncharacterized protein YdaU (DUF1376 family)
MKWYYHEPDAALSGMAELNLEQRGAYITIINLLYSRDGMVPDDDVAVARMMRIHWRSWRALKKQLIAAGKVRVTTDGLLTANRVPETLMNASRMSQDQRRRVSKRWQDYKKAKEINGSAHTISGNTSKTKRIYSSTNLESEEKGAGEESGDNELGAVRQSTSKSIASGELEAIIKRWE